MSVIDLYGWYRGMFAYWTDVTEDFDDETFKKINAETFKYNPQADRWEKLSKKRDVHNYIIANFLNDNLSIQSFNDPSYTEWCSVNENLLYVFKNDVETAISIFDMSNLLKLLYDYKMTRESIIIMDSLSKKDSMIDFWLKSSDSMVRNEARKLKKYSPLLKQRVDLDRCRTAIKQVVESAK